MKEKAEELSEEGKRQYKIFDLKTKVKKEISELGEKVVREKPVTKKKRVAPAQR